MPLRAARKVDDQASGGRAPLVLSRMHTVVANGSHMTAQLPMAISRHVVGPNHHPIDFAQHQSCGRDLKARRTPVDIRQAQRDNDRIQGHQQPNFYGDRPEQKNRQVDRDDP